MSETTHLSAARRTRNSTRRVFVVEDYPLMMLTLVAAIDREPDLVVCGQAEDASQALAAVVSLQPDIVVTDIHLKASNGLDLIKAVHARLPLLPVIAITMFGVIHNAQLALKSGASGFVRKQDGPEKLIATIRDVLATTLKEPDETH